MSRLLRLMVFVSALAASACGDDATTPTSASVPESSVDATTRLFSGTLGVHDSQYYSFTVPQDSGVFVTLASLTRTGTRAPATDRIGLGLGMPRGTDCAITSRQVVSSALAAQLREWTKEGVHCVTVYDHGTLAADVIFAVRIGYFQ